MAKTFGVLDHHQSHDAVPSRFIKKSVAETYVKRMMADKVGNRTIRMRPQRDGAYVLRAVDVREARATFIPEKLPSREIPGVFFQLPQSVQWQLAHRSVSFMELGQ